jgi:hypothetical protein
MFAGTTNHHLAADAGLLGVLLVVPAARVSSALN